jgi:hypothetical protein
MLSVLLMSYIMIVGCWLEVFFQNALRIP